MSVTPTVKMPPSLVCILFAWRKELLRSRPFPLRDALLNAVYFSWNEKRGRTCQRRLYQQSTWQPTRQRNASVTLAAKFLVNQTGGLMGCMIWSKSTTRLYVPLDNTANKCIFLKCFFLTCSFYSTLWMCLGCCDGWLCQVSMRWLSAHIRRISLHNHIKPFCRNGGGWYCLITHS